MTTLINAPRLRCQPITRRAPLAPTSRSILLIMRKPRLVQLSTSINRLSKHRATLVDWSNKRPSKWDYLIAAGKV